MCVINMVYGYYGDCLFAVLDVWPYCFIAKLGVYSGAASHEYSRSSLCFAGIDGPHDTCIYNIGGGRALSTLTYLQPFLLSSKTTCVLVYNTCDVYVYFNTSHNDVFSVVFFVYARRDPHDE